MSIETLKHKLDMDFESVSSFYVFHSLQMVCCHE
jgi:hypothetical protein